jgi:SAM-dependent methyltransferase
MDKNKIAVAVFDKCAELYQQKFMDVSGYHDTLALFCGAIQKPNPEILELACGPGNITKYLLERRADFKILATDLAPKMVELGAINNPAADFMVLDCRKFRDLGRKFDGIMCGFCLPYLSKEEALQLIADASEVLNEQGTLYISTMEDDYCKSEFKKESTGDEIFMHYHEARYLSEGLLENGFKILHLKRQDYPQTQSTDLVLIAQK